MHLTVSLAIVIALCTTLAAQPQIDMVKSYDLGEFNGEGFNDIYSLNNGSFALCGRSVAHSKIAMIDSEGNLDWVIDPGGSSLSAIIEADNGDLVASGRDDHDFFVVRVSPEGDMIWRRQYGEYGSYAIIELKAGDFVACGTGDTAGRIIRMNGDGGVIWDELYICDGQPYGSFKALRETEGGILAAGSGPNEVGWVLKIDPDGGVIWSRTYAEITNLGFAAMVATDGGFVLTAQKTIYIQGVADGNFSLSKIDTRGDVIWHQVYVHQYRDRISERPTGLAKLADGGFILTGRVYLTRPFESRPLAYRTNRSGALLWRNDFNHLFEGREERVLGLNDFNSVVVVNGHTIVACGGIMTQDEEENLQDAMIMRLEPDVLGPLVFYKNPEDSLLTVLSDTSITFTIRARTREGNELNYQWFWNDIDCGNDTTVTIDFDTVGVDTVVCHLTDDDAEITVGWEITVTDLYISAFTPDTLNLTLRRGTSVYFVLDTIRFNEGFDPDFLWKKTNLSNGAVEVVEMADNATYDFPWSGDYTVEGKAYRGESSDQVTWNVAVKGVVWAFVPEALTFDVEPDNVIHFELVPSEPENESLSIQWLVDGELAVEDTTALVWSFSRADLFPPYQSMVSAIVADSVESDTVTWSVTVRNLAVPQNDPSADPPRSAAILCVSPNPFNSTLTIWYSVGAQGLAPLHLAICDLSGRLVADLLDLPHSKLQTPNSKLVWNASSAPAGVYLVRLQSGSAVSTQKVVLMR